MSAATASTTAWRTALLTVLAMLAFAGNSLLTRMALQGDHIDPASFGSVRLASGALLLGAIVRARRGPAAAARRDWLTATMLWAYVVCFSCAYLTLAAGTGALILFGAVQLTMFSVGLAHGERFALLSWGGFALAVAGLVHLVAPGLAAPAPLAALGGVLWLAEPLTARLLLSSLAILGGIALVLFGRTVAAQPRHAR